MYRGKYYFESDNFKLIYNDIFKVIKKFEDKSIDMILQIHHIFFLEMVLHVAEEKWLVLIKANGIKH